MNAVRTISACALALLWATPARGATAAADTLIDVGGHRLHLDVRRGATPVGVILEAGGGAGLDAWATVPDSLAARTGATVVAYDRAGLGESELGPDTLTPAAEVAGLAGALDALGVPRRRIVVGHSYGGLLAMLHAAARPDEVVGLVLVDPMNPGFVAATGDFVRSTAPEIEAPANDTERVIVRMTRTFDDLVERVAAIEPALGIPIVVLTAGEPWWGTEEIDAAWRASHEALADGGERRRLVVAEGSDHDVPAERPDAIVDAVVAMLGQVDAR